MTIAIKKMFAQILFWIYELLDSIFEMFQVLCGIQKVNVEGEDGSKTLLNVFLESSAVTQAFFLILLVAVVIAGLATITSVVKNIVNLKGGERKSHVKTLGQGFGTIIISLTMAFIMIIGISLSGEVLKSISNATSTTVESKFSNELFGMSVEKTYEYEYAEKLEPVYDENGNIKLDENGNEIYQVKKDINGDVEYEKKIKRDENGNPIYIDGWAIGVDPNSLDFSKMTPDDVFGIRDKNLIGLEKEDSECKNWKVDLDSFNFLTAYLVAIVMIIALVFCMLGLVKRVFDIVMLFITLPLISATIPLDDGARFKSWRDTVLSKVVLAYGAVLSVNVFLLIVPIINNLQFEELGWNSGFLENLFKIFLMMGGALSINGGQLLVSRLMGTSADESREMAHSARALLGGIGMAGGLMRGAKNLVIGGTNKFGRERTGVLNYGSRLFNSIGERAGKDKYKNSAGGKMMRKFGRLPQLQKPDPTMTNMAGNIRTIADVLTGGSGGNNGLGNFNNQNVQANNHTGPQANKQSNGISALVGGALLNGANNNAFSKPGKK